MKRFFVASAAAAMAALMLSVPVTADVAQSRYFVDMNAQSYGFWAVDEVDGLYEAGVVRGVGDNRFAPENLMERGDFVLMLQNAFHYPEISKKLYGFVDVKSEDYYYEAVTNARGNGIIDDVPLFQPQQPLKRLDAFKMIYNTMSLYNCIGSNGSTDVSMYTDSYLLLNVQDKIAVGTLTKLGIINGYGGLLNPNNTVTRAEMAVMLTNAINVYKENGSSASISTQVSKPTADDPAPEAPKEDTKPAERITDTYTVTDGASEEINGAAVSVSSGDGITVTGNGTSADISDSTVAVSGKDSIAVKVVRGAEAELTNVDINASASGAVGVYVDNDSEAEIKSSKVFSRYENGRAVENGGEIKISDSTVQSAKSEAIKLYGDSLTDISASDIVTEGKNCGILISNDNSYDKSVINLTDTTFKGDKNGAAIRVENASAVINFNNVKLEGYDTILETGYTYNKGIRESEIELVLNGQRLEGKINADDMSVVTLDLTNGGSFKGVLNYENDARSINVKLSSDSLLELTDDCYIDALIFADDEDSYRIGEDRNFSNVIDDNGATIYYNASNHLNDYLNNGTYALQNGGMLAPTNLDD